MEGFTDSLLVWKPQHEEHCTTLFASARLGKHSTRAGARAVILAPTRELALQTARVVRDLGKHTDLRTATLVRFEFSDRHTINALVVQNQLVVHVHLLGSTLCCH